MARRSRPDARGGPSMEADDARIAGTGPADCQSLDAERAAPQPRRRPVRAWNGRGRCPGRRCPSSARRSDGELPPQTENSSLPAAHPQPRTPARTPTAAPGGQSRTWCATGTGSEQAGCGSGELLPVSPAAWPAPGAPARVSGRCALGVLASRAGVCQLGQCPAGVEFGLARMQPGAAYLVHQRGVPGRGRGSPGRPAVNGAGRGDPGCGGRAAGRRGRSPRPPGGVRMTASGARTAGVDEGRARRVDQHRLWAATAAASTALAKASLSIAEFTPATCSTHTPFGARRGLRCWRSTYVTSAPRPVLPAIRYPGRSLQAYRAVTNVNHLGGRPGEADPDRRCSPPAQGQ